MTLGCAFQLNSVSKRYTCNKHLTNLVLSLCTWGYGTLPFPLQFMALVLHTANINQSGKRHGQLQTKKTRLGRFLWQYGKDERQTDKYCEYLKKICKYINMNWSKNLQNLHLESYWQKAHSRYKTMLISCCWLWNPHLAL